jgi:O-antigen ligase
MRVYVLSLVVLVLSVYAWKDWYKSLCGLIVLSAVLDHPDMPRGILGVPGLNLWNMLFFAIVLARMFEPRRDGHRGDLPRFPLALLLLGLSVVLVGFLRLLIDRQSLFEPDIGLGDVVSDYLVNPLKWVLLGLLLFDGSRGSRRRLALGLASVLSFYFLLGMQVIRWVLPSGVLEGGSLSDSTVSKLRNEIGLHRNDLSVMLAGASWALLAARPLVQSMIARAAIVLSAVVVLFSQILTGGRGGYLAWCAVGLTLGIVRWRRYLLLGPLVVVLVIAFVPSAAERALQGTHGKPTIGADEVDLEELTAGRNLIWPVVLDKIADAPLIGYGRAAMQRTGLSAWFMQAQNEGFIKHPHNAYLEMLLDSGVLGLVIALALYGNFVVAAISLIRDHRSPEFVAVGGIGLALVLSQMVGALSGQSFWPSESTVGMWCAIGLLLRAQVQQQRSGRSVAWGDQISPRTTRTDSLTAGGFSHGTAQPGQ